MMHLHFDAGSKKDWTVLWSAKNIIGVSRVFSLGLNIWILITWYNQSLDACPLGGACAWLGKAAFCN